MTALAVASFFNFNIFAKKVIIFAYYIQKFIALNLNVYISAVYYLQTTGDR